MATAICLDYFYNTLPMDVRTWVQDKKPDTCQKQGNWQMSMYRPDKQAIHLGLIFTVGL